MIVMQRFVILGSDTESSPRTCVPEADDRLVAAGWVRRYSVDADRVEEAIELYRSLGFDVLTRKLTTADYDPVCRGCIASVCPEHVLIYTRRAPAENREGDEPGSNARD